MKDGARFTARRFRLPVGIDPGEGSAGATVRQAHAARQQTLAHDVANHGPQVGGFAKDRGDALLAGLRRRRSRHGGGRHGQKED